MSFIESAQNIGREMYREREIEENMGMQSGRKDMSEMSIRENMGSIGMMGA